MNDEIEQLKEYLNNSKYTIAVTGAGVSYMYGMRRLKSQTSRMNLMRTLTPSYVKKHPDEFYSSMKDAFLDATFEKGPSPVHKALVELEKRGQLQGIVTQNMDCLHTAAGSTNVVEFQGSFNDNVCIDCGEEVHDYTIWGHGEVPRCPKCGGYIMPSNFNRNNKDSKKRMNKAADMIGQADLVLIIGTTGFRSEEYMAKLRPETKLVQINPGNTVFDTMTDINIHMDAKEIFDQILND